MRSQCTPRLVHMKVISNANIYKNAGRHGYNVGIIAQIELSYYEWILKEKV